jgi:rhamnulose-1-phosphate aldolase
MTHDGELPGLESLILAMGAAGRRLSQIDACEGGAGNLSVFVREARPLSDRFSRVDSMLMPEPAPELAHGTFLVTGSGCRLRDIADDPEGNLACVVVDEGGKTAKCYSSPRRQFQRPTSEFNSHIAVHRDVVARTKTGFHALVHAQPRRVTFLSHHPKYDSEARFMERLYRWQPETIVNLPEGIGFLGFEVPGSRALMEATLASLRLHRVAVWQKHGLMARSEHSMMHAVDLVEYVETAASYEYMDLCTGERCPGLSADQLRAICQLWNVEQKVL